MSEDEKEEEEIDPEEEEIMRKTEFALKVFKYFVITASLIYAGYLIWELLRYLQHI